MTDTSKYYEVEGDKLVRKNRTCPKCGPSVFLADHYDRWSCGRCGYTIFKRKGGGGSSRSRTRKRSPRVRKKSK